MGLDTVLNEILPLDWGMGYFDRELQGVEIVSCLENLGFLFLALNCLRWKSKKFSANMDILH